MRIFFALFIISAASVLLLFFKLSYNIEPVQNLSPQITHIRPTSTLFPAPTSIPVQATIGLVGDLGLGRHITSTARSKNDFNWSFQEVAPWLEQNDITFANLESPVINKCPEGKTGTFTFCGDIRFLPYLKQYKFALNLANNHILNYGKDGLNQTIDYLSTQDTPFVYSHSPDTEFKKIDINGVTFGFLGYDFITYPQLDKQTLIKQAKHYDNQVDWLIVSLHWGNEYLPKAESWRYQLAHDLVDNGADIIHGHHPHVWQPDEIYKNKPIYYSLGNFIFDQSWSHETSHSKAIRLTLTKDTIISTDVFPYEIRFNSQPRFTSN